MADLSEEIKKLKNIFCEKLNITNFYINLEPYMNELSLYGKVSTSHIEQYINPLDQSLLSFTTYEYCNNGDRSEDAFRSFFKIFFMFILSMIKKLDKDMNNIYLLSIKEVNFTSNQQNPDSETEWINTNYRLAIAYSLNVVLCENNDRT